MLQTIERQPLKKHIGFLRFTGHKKGYLLTNDTGGYCILSVHEFSDFIEGRLDTLKKPRLARLRELGFLADTLNLEKLIGEYASRRAFLSAGTNLHIVVITLRCDHGCIYCQTSSGRPADKGLDMDITTARQTVDRIFESQSKLITIEFQGGEPTLNFDTLRFIVDYASEKNRSAGKDLLFSLVTNLVSLNQKQFDYLVKNKVSICTSLDGPEILQNKQRIFFEGRGSYRKTLHWLKKFKKSFGSREFPHKINALATITRHSFPHYKKIVDEYTGLGLNIIHLRPANPFGLASHNWGKIGFSADEFLSFYRKTFDYILKKNLAGEFIAERTAAIFLKKIFSDIDPNYLDLRSPCGAGIGQLAYNFDGDVFSCDEGRMLAKTGDDAFKIGNVRSNDYHDFMASPVLKAVCLASCLDNLAGCQDCAYMPYCGVCPAYNYSLTGNIYGKEPHNDRCRINKGILDHIFDKIEDTDCAEIFKTWINHT